MSRVSRIPDPQPVTPSSRSGRLRLVPRVITVDPLTRIEGHLKIEVLVDNLRGTWHVVDAWCTGALFRGFEQVLIGRAPWDAVPITQRICGVCPVSHGLAAVLALDAATGVNVPANGRILRNLVLGANYLQSHLLHFYHLSLPDYIDGPAMPPWQPAWTSDRRLDPATNARFVNNYLTALTMRRKAHELAAVFGGRLPHPPAYLPGGLTCPPTTARIAQCQTFLNELIAFITDVWIPDVKVLSLFYDDYFEIGGGPGNLLAYGVFDLDAGGTQKLLRRGRVAAGVPGVQSVDINAIAEDVHRAWYEEGTSGLPPAAGVTSPQFPKPDAYSWLKAPRYDGQPYEVGPLARLWINGDYSRGVSVMDRHVARAQEALKVARAMQTWLAELQVGQPVYQHNTPPASAAAYGLTEAPRGALGHWLQISATKISRYQVVTPTCWNASPRDTAGVPGPIEQALIGTIVDDFDQPVELLRVVHSFDPCLACAVHMVPVKGRSVAPFASAD